MACDPARVRITTSMTSQYSCLMTTTPLSRGSHTPGPLSKVAWLPQAPRICKMPNTFTEAHCSWSSLAAPLATRSKSTSTWYPKTSTSRRLRNRSRYRCKRVKNNNFCTYYRRKMSMFGYRFGKPPSKCLPCSINVIFRRHRVWMRWKLRYSKVIWGIVHASFVRNNQQFLMVSPRTPTPTVQLISTVPDAKGFSSLTTCCIETLTEPTSVRTSQLCWSSATHR